jgi:uncharacterized membrane protein HdeD (DUF308 family)
MTRPRHPEDHAMNNVLARNWWALALRGAVAILLAISIFLEPGILALLMAAYLVVDGVFAIAAGVAAAERHERWGWLVLEGILDLVAAVLAASYPLLALFALDYLVAFWAMLSGLALILAAVRLGRQSGEWLMLLAGLLSLIWGLALALWPFAGIVVLSLWIAVYAAVFGVVMLVLAFRLRARARA